MRKKNIEKKKFKGLKDEDWIARAAMATVFGDAEDVEGVEPLIEALNDDYVPVVRQMAAEALNKIGE